MKKILTSISLLMVSLFVLSACGNAGGVKSDLALTDGNNKLTYGMDRTDLEKVLGESSPSIGEVYEKNEVRFNVIYRDEKAVGFLVRADDEVDINKWSIAGISFGDSRDKVINEHKDQMMPYIKTTLKTYSDNSPSDEVASEFMATKPIIGMLYELTDEGIVPFWGDHQDELSSTNFDDLEERNARKKQIIIVDFTFNSEDKVVGFSFMDFHAAQYMK